MTRIISGSLLILCCLTLEVSAQRTAPVSTTISNAPRTTYDPLTEMKEGRDSASAISALEGRILAVKPAENRFVVEQRGSGKRFNIPVNLGTAFKADKGTELAGRKRLILADFKPGHFVKVVYKVGPKNSRSSTTPR